MGKQIKLIMTDEAFDQLVYIKELTKNKNVSSTIQSALSLYKYLFEQEKARHEIILQKEVIRKNLLGFPVSYNKQYTLTLKEVNKNE